MTTDSANIDTISQFSQNIHFRYRVSKHIGGISVVNLAVRTRGDSKHQPPEDQWPWRTDRYDLKIWQAGAMLKMLNYAVNVRPIQCRK